MNETVDPTRIYQQAVRSVAIVETEDGLATGFFVSPNGDSKSHLFVTNAHVVDGGKIEKIRMQDGKDVPVIGVSYIDESADIAVVLTEVSMPALMLGNSPSVGQSVFLLGNPRGLEYSFSEGMLSRVVQPDKDDARSEVIQVTANTSPGSSGSPILNQAGRVIGIHHSRLGGAQGFGIGASVKAIRDVLSDTISTLNLLTKYGDQCMKRQISSVCETMGTMIMNAGLISLAAKFYKTGCDKGHRTSCAGLALAQLKAGIFTADEYLEVADSTCKGGEKEIGCKTAKELSFRRLRDNRLELRNLSIQFPKGIGMFKPSVIEFLPSAGLKWMKNNSSMITSATDEDEGYFGAAYVDSELPASSSNELLLVGVNHFELKDELNAEDKNMPLSEFASILVTGIEKSLKEERAENVTATLVEVREETPQLIRARISGSLETRTEEVLFILGDTSRVVQLHLVYPTSRSAAANEAIDSMTDSIAIKSAASAFHFKVEGSWTRVLVISLAVLAIFQGITWWIKRSRPRLKSLLKRPESAEAGRTRSSGEDIPPPLPFKKVPAGSPKSSAAGNTAEDSGRKAA